MIFKQFYLGCLAHASYLIGSEGLACIIDPQRDIDEYLDELKKHNLKLEYIIETHLHADFVSGHKELSERTGAQVVYSEKAKFALPHLAVKDGEVLKLGDIELTILATPGHTPESICVVARDKTGPAKLFSGDTLFIGDVGRPDLAGQTALDAEVMAGHLYDSLHNKLMVLPDDTEVLPAHGAGSLCGKNISQERSSTLGQQRQFNWALKPMERQAFIQSMTTELPEIPKYFGEAVKTNRQGATALADLPAIQLLTPQQVADKQKTQACLLDVRSPEEFGDGHLPGSINIGLGGQFASFSGILIDGKQEKIIIGTKEQAHEAVTRLARAGLENVTGYFDDLKSWQDAGHKLTTVAQMSVQTLAKELEANPGLFVLDVRRPPEYKGGHVPGAKPLPLNELTARLRELNKDQLMHVICAGGYRSSMAVSLLLQNGFTKLVNIQGGTMAWRKAELPVDAEATATACSGS